MPPDKPGRRSTFPPRFCGGNIDCKELIAGSTLYLPVPVEGGLFSIGNGHAVQGEGEVAGPALECPIEQVEATFQLHPELRLSFPRASTPAGFVTFGFDENLIGATMIVLEGMLDLMAEKYKFDRKESLVWSTLVVDFRVIQIVNGGRGTHAILPYTAVDGMIRE